MTRTYVVDESRLGRDDSAAAYHEVLAWAAARGDRFVLRLDRKAYDDRDQLARLEALGESGPTRVEGIPDDAVGRALSKIGRALGGSEELVEVVGEPGPDFLSELRGDVPAGARGGEIAPVEDVVVLDGDRRVYGSYDYAARQVLELDDDEVEDLRARLAAAGLEREAIAVHEEGER